MTPAHEFSSDLIVKAANIVRGLSIDAVQAANSGHPGLPLGAADFATVLWTQFLRHNPKNPHWQNRDRFVLSGGHGSMLLYALLHLTGYDVSLADLQAFRQWGSCTPGHPEYGHTPGVETTTGPLGQGLANAVGMAMAEAMLAARFNETDFPVVDHYTYVIATDGDLQEGVTHEACALAGHQQLGKLVVLYDDNHITIDGTTDLSFSEEVLQRFAAYGWHTQQVDGHDPQAVYEAIVAARENTSQPSIISCKTIIGKGSPHKAGTAGVHGAPLGEEELRLTKEALGLPPDEAFYVPANIAEFFGEAVSRGAHWQAEWDALFSAYDQAHPDKAATYMNLDKVPPQALDLQSFT
ncbi:MAG TPA: transketolase, partial [Flammeovirgaceae bacterium]|nr:transketolase [Flammeovirgaceae bacterium]